jgi:hypothetical protein
MAAHIDYTFFTVSRSAARSASQNTLRTSARQLHQQAPIIDESTQIRSCHCGVQAGKQLSWLD